MRFTDRIGKRRSVALGSILMVPTGLLLAVGDLPLGGGVLLVAVFFLGFEFAIVSAIPIIGELHPEARASSIGLAVAFMTIGRAGAALAGTWLYTAYGMGGATVPAATCGALTAALMWWAVPPPHRTGG
jgi:predicted MFS family arabinose efflux permease